jgi:phage antirepressor YoqD-like protein/phage anti-repressor protein
MNSVQHNPSSSPTLSVALPITFGKGGSESQLVNARDLHRFLEIGRDFSHWINEHIAKFDFRLGFDYIKFGSPKMANQTSGRGGDRRRIDYFLTLDMAKELSMVQRNQKGKDARAYFIAMEKRARAMVSPGQHFALPQTLAEALALAADIERQREQLAEENAVLAPKAQFFDRVCNADDAYTVNEFAKIIGTGQNRLFNWLRDRGWIYKNGRYNVPYQDKIDAGVLKLVMKEVNIRGILERYPQIFITGKGGVVICESMTPTAVRGAR